MEHIISDFDINQIFDERKMLSLANRITNYYKPIDE
jgi:hypothetical protein